MLCKTGNRILCPGSDGVAGGAAMSLLSCTSLKVEASDSSRRPSLLQRNPRGAALSLQMKSCPIGR